MFNKRSDIFIFFMVFTYPYLTFYMPFVSNALHLSSTAIITIYYSAQVFYNLKGSFSFFFKEILGLTLLILFTFIFFIHTDDYSRGLFILINLILGGLLCFVIYKKKIVYKLLMIFSISTTLFSVLLKLGVLQFNFAYYDYGNIRFGYLKGDNIFLDPNWLAFWLSIAILFFYEKARVSSSIQLKAFYLLLVCTDIYFLLSTKSRSVLIALLAAFLFSFFIRKKWIPLTFVFLSAPLLYFYRLIDTNTLEVSVLDRILKTNLLESDRFELLRVSFLALTEDIKSLLLGHGLGDGDRAIGKYYYYSQMNDDGIYRFNNHNLYTDWILQTGLMGLLLLCLVIVFLLKSVSSSIQTRNTLYISFLILFCISAAAYNPLKNTIWPLIFTLLYNIYRESKGSSKEITDKQ